LVRPGSLCRGVPRVWGWAREGVWCCMRTHARSRFEDHPGGSGDAHLDRWSRPAVPTRMCTWSRVQWARYDARGEVADPVRIGRGKVGDCRGAAVARGVKVKREVRVARTVPAGGMEGVEPEAAASLRLLSMGRARSCVAYRGRCKVAT
jgi:hypothetical protein